VAILSAHGIEARLPAGFEGRIFRRVLPSTPTPTPTPRAAVPGGRAEVTRPVAHFATFALPADVAEVGDFGSGVVTLMGPDDIFAVLFEYGPESTERALFAHQGMPRMLGPDDFRPMTLRRGLANQSGTQWFFTESGRPFTLYAVLGHHGRRFSLVPRLNSLLHSLQVRPT
jgi:hypothetical protein